MIELKENICRFKRKLKYLDLRSYSTYRLPDSILLKYWDFENNWGDFVSPYIIEKITGRKAVSSNLIFNYLHKSELLACGSIIVGDVSNYVIWGSGVLSERTTIINKPRRVLALRGLNSLKKIQKVGADCDVFGDPVLLFPDIFSPVGITKKYKYGIVPHYKDKTSLAIRKIIELNDPSIKIIDVQTGIEDFVKEVLSCENILSSSLHGLILAEAFGIPTCRLILSKDILGGDFKFYDYYSGVGIKKIDSVLIDDDISNLKVAFAKCSLKDLDFKKNELKSVLIEYMNKDRNK